MTKSKSSMVTSDILYLTIDTFLDVVKINFPLLSIGWYLFRVVSGTRYLSIGSNENIRCITSTSNNTALGFGHDSLNSLKTGKVN